MATFRPLRMDWRYAGAVFVVAALYVALAKLGFSLAATTKQVTAVWPPTGIALAALLVFGYRIWPAIWIGAFASNAMTGEPWLTAAAIACGNTLAPVLGTALLRRVGFDTAMDRVRDVLALALLGSAVTMIVSAANGTLQLALSGIVAWHAFPRVFALWWSGDAMGVLLVAPLLLTWSAKPTVLRKLHASELLLFVLAILAVRWFALHGHWALGYPIYPLIIWSALRFTQRVTSAAIVFIAGTTIWAFARDLVAPFPTNGSFDERLAQLVVFMAVFAVTGLVLGAVVAERRTAHDRVLAVAETLQSAFLPDVLPTRSDVRFDAVYLPAGEETNIGGDWYDAFELPDGRVVVSVGDVVGHGLHAAINAGRLRQSIFTTAFSEDDPATVLAKVNRAHRFVEESVATALVAVIDPVRLTLRYAGAGHPPPVVAGPTLGATLLPYDGIPLGIQEKLMNRSRTVPLERDAVVLFYTDGITEIHRNIEAAERQLVALAHGFSENGFAAKAASAVLEVMMGSSQRRDDAVVLIVQLTAS
jgi:integral membrane sensor domain MASE1